MESIVKLRFRDGLFLTIVYVGLLTYLRNLYEFFLQRREWR